MSIKNQTSILFDLAILPQDIYPGEIISGLMLRRLYEDIYYNTVCNREIESNLNVPRKGII